MTNKLMLRRRHIMLPETAQADGRIASFKTSIPRLLRGLTARIEPLQLGSGDPSPSNVRALSGWPGLTLYHAGHNISSVGAFDYPTDGTVCVIADGLTPGLTYNASAHRDSVTTTGSGIRIRFQYDVGGETIYDPGGYGSTGWMSKSCAVPANATNVRVAIQRATAVSGYTISDIQLELGEARTDYVPFAGLSTIPVSWSGSAGTIGAGTLDIQTGLLTVTHGIYDASGATIYGTTPGTTARFEPNPPMASGSWYTDEMAICNVLPRVQSSASVGIRFGATNTSIYLYKLSTIDASLTTRAAVEAWLSQVGLTVCYPLADQQTYQLTGAQVATLAGENNVWTDVGDISVIYRA